MNDAVATAPKRYALSFTTGALLVREAGLLAPVFLDCRDWEQVRDDAVERNLLQARTHSTGVRLVRETVKRLSALSSNELELLSDATASERGYLMWVAACRRYEFIGEFAEEVVRERFLLLTPTLAYPEFDGFVRGKALWHHELEDVKESTLKKLREVVFRMLVEAGLLTDTGRLVAAVISGRLLDAFNVHEPSDLRYFPTSPVAAR